MFKKKFVRILNPAGDLEMMIPRKDLYEPIAKQMDEEQVPEFFWKFLSYLETLGAGTMEAERMILNLKVRALTGNLDNLNGRPNRFLSILNSNTNCFGVVDWDSFLSETEVEKALEEAKREVLSMSGINFSAKSC